MFQDFGDGEARYKQVFVVTGRKGVKEGVRQDGVGEPCRF